MIKRKTIGKIQLILGIVLIIGLIIAGAYINNHSDLLLSQDSGFKSNNLNVSVIDITNLRLNSASLILNLADIALFAVVIVILSIMLILEGLANISEEK
jgi:hypothetical protein